MITMPPTAKEPLRPSPYSAHLGVAMEAKAVSELKEKTGRTLEEWIALTQRLGPKTEKERTAWLKEKHGLGTNYAKWLASRAEGKSRADDDPDALVDAMYASEKSALRPIHDRLIELALALGNDVTITPCSTIVPIRRCHVVAQIKPATKTASILVLPSRTRSQSAGSSTWADSRRRTGSRIEYPSRRSRKSMTR
jgi:hypothetical protein